MNAWTRRRILQAAVASGGSALLPLGSILAQGGVSLLRATKQALVIGNSKYKHAPLKNPVNDAQGMAAALKSAGFAVTVGLELSQTDIRDAIRAYTDNLAKTKAVGLFYFAGHGVQLAWRNYLIPVDADIVNIEELRQRAVDVNNLIEGITKAGNPMNIVILDACRNNPFGGSVRLDQKGLSQLDAPPGTLLAYATAPGNTAIDGEGEHGLYTEHLLREIKVPEAKVEDVFKRVRLGVRLRSKGLQVPWESTSLEGDFWFLPPKELKKLADAEIEREFKQELELWERIKSAIQPEPLEDYLRRFPSGRYTELAQLRLDQVLQKQGEKRVETVPASNNPYTKGSARTDTAYKIGDRWTYRTFDLFTKLDQGETRWVVTEISDKEIVFNDRSRVTDLLGNVLLLRGSSVWGPNQTAPSEFAVGKRWNTRFDFTPENRSRAIVDLELRVADREQITLPAGTFNAFRVEAHGWAIGGGMNNSWDWKRWYAPEQVRNLVAAEVLVKTREGRVIQSYRIELMHFEQL